MSSAAVIVTHDSAAWIAETLTSVLNQQTPLDQIVVVDDNSRDSTVDIIRRHAVGRPVEVITSTSEATDIHTRIAQNFLQGVQYSKAEVVLLGDHDDSWHPHRAGHQIAFLQQHPEAAMLASDGLIVGQDGPSSRTLRDVFPVPIDFNDWRSSQQFGYAVRHSLATGSASGIRPASFPELSIPKGWLHDRWWSLVATAHHRLVIDPTVVIDYRVSDGQQVGLATQHQEADAIGWLMHHGKQLVRTTQRMIDLAPLFMASR